MLVRILLRRAWLAALVGGAIGAAALRQIEFWLGASWPFDTVTVGALAGAVLMGVVASRNRTLPITHGSARFRSRRELREWRRGDGLIIGRDEKSGKLLRYGGPGHLLTVAPTRAGKGVGAIIPNLLTADRPVIVIDPKGENFRVAGRARSRFGPVYPLDPFGVTGGWSAAYNPLGAIDPAGDRFL